jgi:hypothetical protein
VSSAWPVPGTDGTPFVAGTLRGFRTWRPLGRWEKLPDGAVPLASVAQSQVVWTPTLTARCIPPESFAFWCPPPKEAAGHPSPSATCSCGIYAWYEPGDTYILRGRVFGVVQASGRILMGDRGFRAERTSIAAIVTRNRRIAAACARVDIPVYRRRRDLLRDFPAEDRTGLLGERPRPRRARPPAPPVAGRGNRALFSAVWGSASPPPERDA